MFFSLARNFHWTTPVWQSSATPKKVRYHGLSQTNSDTEGNTDLRALQRRGPWTLLLAYSIGDFPIGWHKAHLEGHWVGDFHPVAPLIWCESDPCQTIIAEVTSLDNKKSPPEKAYEVPLEFSFHATVQRLLCTCFSLNSAAPHHLNWGTLSRWKQAKRSSVQVTCNKMHMYMYGLHQFDPILIVVTDIGAGSITQWIWCGTRRKYILAATDTGTKGPIRLARTNPSQLRQRQDIWATLPPSNRTAWCQPTTRAS